ncbi:MAG: relaxase domain-containing protein [Acidimicrobiia bacterium]|nr:relaxase domain-containing protein [Acidimicrobiia bacterium]
MSIAKLTGAPEAAAYYLDIITSGRDDYYLTAGEAPGRWAGSAAPLLGLSRAVDREELRGVLAGRHPDTGEQLATRRVQGFDLTLSAPKSVSLLWGLGDERVVADVIAAHDTAVAAAVRYFEDEGCVVRRGRGGATRLPGAGLVVAAFRHRTSREADPNLHTHLVTANMTLGPDGRWSALHTTDIYRHGRTAGFVYQSVLRHELTERLGIRFEPTGPGFGEIAGIPERARRAFSRRRVAIEDSMATHGTHSARGAQAATLASRPAKPEAVDETTLRRKWAERAAEIGFELSAPTSEASGAVEAGDDELGRALTEQDATFDRRQAFRAVAETATQGLDYPTIRQRVEGLLAGPAVVEVAPGCWTTPEMLALEADALHRATRGPHAPAVERQTLEHALRVRPTITAEQALALKAVTMTDAPVVVIVGHAGTGKTFALDAARAAWTETGVHCRGVALAARAARELEAGSGIPSQTIASLLQDLDRGTLRLTHRDVLVVDEAGMVGTRHLHRLIQATTEASAKLVLVGDPKQLAEIDAGGLFASLARCLGHAELTENRRLEDPAQHATARALRDAEIGTALRRMQRIGSLTLDVNTDRLRERMILDWYAERSTGRHVVMLALHRHDVADLNHRARAQLLANGDLGPAVLTSDDLELRVGDQVLALRNDRHIGIVNGTQGTVIGGSNREVEIETRDGIRLAVPHECIAAGHLTHGYAMTIHKSQGMTCDVSLVLGDDTLHQEAGYTSITRGRDRNHVYALAAIEPGQPTADLQRALALSTAKQTAHDRGGLGL